MKPLRALAPALCLAAVAFTAAGCPDTLSQLCPAGSQQAGVFNTTLTFNAADPQQCYYGVDGGVPDASLAATGADAGPETFSSVICSGFDPNDGGPLVYLALPQIVRASTLGPGGTFSFSTSSLVTGTACGCNILVEETIAGQLTPTVADTPVQVNIDGGLPSISGFTGTVVDLVDGGDDAGVSCSCNLPCDLQYTLSGATF
jgi:hypothetical protein